MPRESDGTQERVLLAYPTPPQVRPALLPDAGETVSVGWLRKEAIVLIGVAPAVVCGGDEANLDAGDGALNINQGPCSGNLILEAMDHDPGTSSFDGGWSITPDPNNAGQWISSNGHVQWQIYVFDGYWYALGSRPISPASVIYKSPASGTCPPRDGWTLDSAIDSDGQAIADPSGSIELVY